MDPQIVYALVLAATGVIVGFACGLLGVGGGFIMVPVQIWALSSSGIDPTIAVRVAFGTSLAVILPTALSGCHGHYCRGAVLWRQGITLGLSGLAGALTGGTIAAHAPGDLLKMVFGVVLLAGTLRMLLAGKIRSSEVQEEGLLPYILWGFAVGVVSGMTGIGGGVILVPAMVVGLGFSMHQAVGTSSVAIAFNSVGGTLAYALNGLGIAGLPLHSVGYIDLLQFALLAGTSVPMAQLGARAAHRLPGEQLRYVFMALMIYIGLRMMGVFAWLGLPI
ncbi:MAG TPA: sulfite exporter TauE/SafE family protein [Methanothrix sp.]|nr:sulfite exporter TauE/SafE family protein [Methanothrix sp.]